MEAYVNEVLSSNSSLAARGKPPMEFEKLDKLALKYLDNKRHFEKSFKVESKRENDEEKDKFKSKSNSGSHRQDLNKMRSRVGTLKSSSGKQICLFFNTSKGCVVKNCKFEHSCCYVKADGKLCSARHMIKDHVK